MRRLQACNGGNHTSWSKDCPARIKELQRARAAKLTLPKLFPVATITQFFTESFKDSQAEKVEFNRPPNWSGK
jgi:hypothetical protein